MTAVDWTQPLPAVDPALGAAALDDSPDPAGSTDLGAEHLAWLDTERAEFRASLDALIDDVTAGLDGWHVAATARTDELATECAVQVRALLNGRASA